MSVLSVAKLAAAVHLYTSSIALIDVQLFGI